MKRYEDIGIKVHLTEITVKCNTMTNDTTKCEEDPLSDSDLQLQA